MTLLGISDVANPDLAAWASRFGPQAICTELFELFSTIIQLALVGLSRLLLHVHT